MRLKLQTKLAFKYAGPVACLRLSVQAFAALRSCLAIAATMQDRTVLPNRFPSTANSSMVSSMARRALTTLSLVWHPNPLGDDALRVYFEAAKAYWRALRYPVSQRPLIFEHELKLT